MIQEECSFKNLKLLNLIPPPCWREPVDAFVAYYLRQDCPQAALETWPSVVVVRPVNTWHRWDETCLLDIIVIKSTDVVGTAYFSCSPTDLSLAQWKAELKSMFEKQAGVEWFDLIQTFHACKIDECWFNLEWPHYNKHNMGKTVGELHAMLNEYKKGLPKKAETLQVMMIKGGKIQKSNKKSLKSKAKDDTCHHCIEVGQCKRNCPAYLAELIKKKKQVGTESQFFNSS
ncbi:hypothetical protein Tco_0830142 [Tanacetum coccineum]